MTQHGFGSALHLESCDSTETNVQASGSLKKYQSVQTEAYVLTEVPRKHVRHEAEVTPDHLSAQVCPYSAENTHLILSLLLHKRNSVSSSEIQIASSTQLIGIYFQGHDARLYPGHQTSYAGKVMHKKYCTQPLMTTPLS